ncbi:MAG: hypothetical protein ACI4IM_03075 [Acutalibacteraceae bacterium]
MSDMKIYKFFPLATVRLWSLYKYINRMYENDYKIVDIILDCVLVFERSQKKEGYMYFILTEQYRRDSRKKKWNDIEFLEKRNPKFHKGNGEQFEKFKGDLDADYYIYLTKHISMDEYKTLCEYRKNFLLKAIVYRFIMYSVALIAIIITVACRYLK